MTGSAARLDLLVAAARPGPPDQVCRHRAILVGAEALVALGGLAGTVQLLTGTVTPPVSDLEPLGRSTWVLPGVWLFATVAVPASAAGWLAWRRAPLAPPAVLVASGTLALELVVQIPFIGTNVLQAVFGAFAGGLAGLALDARRAGWWPAGWWPASGIG
ncbi:hypothetical protein [Pengzhenrongella frigida]|uniref:Uncharacterized protein n=1 Tax=Pengzhenrongella frigida TaxID=1259133 RepID=A0A4Q5N424_9MICO|nr:hypothetical protein [Cellulomonas sp. HLT2-17]RYV52926.1 hypothetical protein EUA98_00060 [Cellulomonas sp. HLT2-17]